MIEQTLVSTAVVVSIIIATIIIFITNFCKFIYKKRKFENDNEPNDLE